MRNEAQTLNVQEKLLFNGHFCWTSGPKGASFTHQFPMQGSKDISESVDAYPPAWKKCTEGA